MFSKSFCLVFVLSAVVMLSEVLSLPVAENPELVRQVRSPLLKFKKHQLLGSLFGGGSHYESGYHGSHYPEHGGHYGYGHESGSFAGSVAGSGSHGGYGGAVAGGYGGGSQSQSQSQSATIHHGPYTISLSQSQSQSGARSYDDDDY